MVAFWGERYRDYFVDLFLPSMLAPSNLRLMRVEDGHRFYIATPREDWEATAALPIIQRLSRHAQPHWIEIDARPEEETVGDEGARYAAVLRHMKLCQRKVLEAGYDRSAYGSLHFPDTIISDGMVASLLGLARAGCQLVLCPALRQTEEDVLADLQSAGLWSRRHRPSMTTNELSLAPRQAAALAVRHLHPEMEVFEQGAQGQPSLPPFRFWRMPRGGGIVLQTQFIIPVLMDYAIVPCDHTRCLDDEAIENVYVSVNFKKCRAVHVVRDSDEFVMLSLTPRSVDHSMRVAVDRHRSALRLGYERLCDIRRSYEFYVLRKKDAIRHNLFRILVRWHGKPIDEVSRQAEHRIERLIARAVGDYYARGPLGELGPFGRYRFTWRTVLLDVPWFELPSLLRGKMIEFVLQVPPLRRVLRLNGKRGRSRRP
jgi:hypothetical protein